MKDRRHPAWVREIRLRTTGERWSRAVGLSLLAALPVALGAVVAWSRGALDILWTPAYLIPVIFLQLLVWGAVWIRARSGLVVVAVSSDGVGLVREGLRFSAAQRVRTIVSVEEVSSVSMLDRPEGRSIVFCRGGDDPVSFYLGLDAAGDIAEFLGRLPRELKGLAEAEAVLSQILPPADYETLVRGDLVPASGDFDKVLACHEALGCWQLASEQILDVAEAAGPTKDDLERLWRVERMRLPLVRLHGFLTRAAGVIPDVVAADRIRLALALGFRRDLEEMFAHVHQVESLPASMEALPLDVWDRARRSGAPFRSGMFHAFVPQGHVSLSSNAVDLGAGRVLPLEFVVAMMARSGYVGVRSVVLFDIWGQRHEVAAGVLGRDVDDWITALRLSGPHIMELREGPAVAFRRSLALADRLAGH